MANHITNLTNERDELRAQLDAALEAVVELQTYLASAKFRGPDADYVHVSTDMAPKLRNLRSMLIR